MLKPGDLVKVNRECGYIMPDGSLHLFKRNEMFVIIILGPLTKRLGPEINPSYMDFNLLCLYEGNIIIVPLAKKINDISYYIIDYYFSVVS